MRWPEPPGQQSVDKPDGCLPTLDVCCCVLADLQENICYLSECSLAPQAQLHVQARTSLYCTDPILQGRSACTSNVRKRVNLKEY